MRILGLLLGLSACVVVPVPLPVMTISQPQVRTLAANVAPDAGFDASFQAVRSTPIRYNAQLGAIAKAIFLTTPPPRGYAPVTALPRAVSRGAASVKTSGRGRSRQQRCLRPG